VRFGRRTAGVDAIDGQPALHVALPVLAGPADDWLLDEAAEPVRDGAYTLFRGRARLAGFAAAEAGADLEEAALDLYRRLFAAAAGMHLYRIWNYVPAINARVRGLENYRRFCRGRSFAFEEHFGRGFRRRLPAASAVGAAGGPLALGFLAGRAKPRYFENPNQVPAFEYPREHGPSPPSFSRATVVSTRKLRQIFLSGTASIRGHRTVAPHDLDGQLACTLENLNLIARAAGGDRGLGPAAGRRRTFRVHLRRGADHPRVAEWLGRELLGPGDTVSYCRADLCRADLLVEIEAELTDAGPAA
jgi:hypothetical protein